MGLPCSQSFHTALAIGHCRGIPFRSLRRTQFPGLAWGISFVTKREKINRTWTWTIFDVSIYLSICLSIYLSYLSIYIYIYIIYIYVELMWKTIANETTCYSELFTTNDFTLAGLGSCRSWQVLPWSTSLDLPVWFTSCGENRCVTIHLSAVSSRPRVHSQRVGQSPVAATVQEGTTGYHTWPMSLETSWAARLGSNDLGSSQRPH